MIRASERQWSTSQQGIQRTQLLPAHKEYRQPPQNLQPGDEALFDHELERSWDPCYAVALNQLSVIGATWVQWRYRRIVNNFKKGTRSGGRKLSRLRDLAQLRYRVQHIGEALWVHDDWSANYFHWITDVLPKLQAWRERGENCRTVLLPKSLLDRRYVGDSLQLLGFGPIVFSRSRLEINRLITIDPTAPTGNFRADLLRRLRQDLLADIGTPLNTTASLAIYISRADASQRFLDNEAELLPVLKTASVKVVQLEGRSLAEQIHLFRDCKLLVGLHGAGLTNMLWMPSGSMVIEIRRRGDNHNNCYFAMACALGHSYNYLQAEDLFPDQTTHSARLHLESIQLEQLLKDSLPC